MMTQTFRRRSIPFFLALLAAALLTQFLAVAQNAGKASDLRTVMWNQAHRLASAEEQRNRNFFPKTLDDALMLVAFNGLVLTKRKMVRNLNYIDVSHYRIENLKTRELGPDAALVTNDL
jgi:hypothetical protein